MSHTEGLWAEVEELRDRTTNPPLPTTRVLNVLSRHYLGPRLGRLTYSTSPSPERTDTTGDVEHVPYTVLHEW